MTDEELIEKCKRDSKLFAELYRRYGHLMYGWCLSYLKIQNEAEDAVMDIMENLLNNLHRYHIKEFKNWLFMVCRNHCLAQQRARSKAMLQDLDEVNLLAKFVQNEDRSTLDIDTTLETLHRAVDQLPDGQRHCIISFYLRGQRYKEIAVANGWSEQQVKSHIQNGKRSLRISIEKSLQSE